jgi:hypothetical protein
MHTNTLLAPVSGIESAVSLPLLHACLAYNEETLTITLIILAIFHVFTKKLKK